jgi:hypothetical protein
MAFAKREFVNDKWTQVTASKGQAAKLMTALANNTTERQSIMADLTKLVGAAVKVPAGTTLVVTAKFGKVSYNFAEGTVKAAGTTNALEL